jgi:hypothetical protein
MGDLANLLTKIEDAIDAEPALTRTHHGHDGKLVAEAELTFRRAGWTARCKVRGAKAKGRSARHMTDVSGDGETPELAVEELIKGLWAWKEVLNERT